MVAIDPDKSSERAFHAAIKAFKPETDRLYLVAITSNWDYLNTEKNAARLELYKYESWCEANGTKYRSIQTEASDISGEYVSIIARKKVDVFYIGSSSFHNCADEDNLLFNAFSSIRRFFAGSVASNISSQLATTGSGASVTTVRLVD